MSKLISYKPDDHKYQKYFKKGEVSYICRFGEYVLTVTTHKTKKGCWNYTKGVVTRGDEVICEIQRNYSSFLHGFMIGEDGDTYLIAGHHYQKFVVVNLDTGKWTKHEDDSFCFSSVAAGEGYILAHGCYWACPYDYRVYKVNSHDDVRLVCTVPAFCRSCEDPGRLPYWSEGGYFRIPFFCGIGRDGLDEDDDYWCDWYTEGDMVAGESLRFIDKPLEDRHMFEDDNNTYKPEYIENFLYHLIVSPNEAGDGCVYALEDHNMQLLKFLGSPESIDCDIFRQFSKPN